MSVIAGLRVNGATPSTVGGTGVSVKIFPDLPGASIGVANTGPGLIYVPGSKNGQLLRVVAAGNFEVGSGGTCPSVTFDLKANTAAVGATPSYTTIATSGAITAQNLTGTFYPFFMDVRFVGDSGSGIVNGTQTWLVDNTLQSASVVRLTNNLSGISFAHPIAFSLALGVTFSVSESGNSSNLTQFCLVDV